jgi:gamma-glutamyltranspeptidase/glutathione hydrolase
MPWFATSFKRGSKHDRALLLFVIVSYCFVAGICFADAETSPRRFSAVVSVSQPQAAEAGAEILRRGGDAVDAAMAIQYALGVTEPQSSGIGGGSFILVWRAKDHSAWFIDGREAAPMAASPHQFEPFTFDEASMTGLSVGVPGTVAAFQVAHTRWGNLGFGENIKPAIDLAENGFPLGKYVAKILADKKYQPRLNEAARAVFMPNGRPIEAGALLVQKDLARTLRLLADNPAQFYRGEIAQAIIEAQRTSRAGPGGEGRMQIQDLLRYEVRVRKPLEGQYRGYTILTAPSPSAGGTTLLETLGMLEQFPIGDQKTGYGEASPRTWHTLIEALRLASADRLRYLGDDKQTPLPTDQLLSKNYLKARAAKISDQVLKEVSYDSFEQEKGRNTTHFSVVDQEGNIVLVTSTVDYIWGTGMMVPGWGFFLNNELTDFNLKPEGPQLGMELAPNDAAPGRRPRSSMAPTLLLKNDQPFEALGSPGSASIISTVLQTIVRTVDFSQPLKSAVEAPRFAQTSPRDEPSFESGWHSDVLDGLSKVGHVLKYEGRGMGSVQALEWSADGRPHGVADSRRDGTVIEVPVQ